MASLPVNTGRPSILPIEYVDAVTVSLIDASASDDMVALAAWVSNANDDVDKLSEREKVKGLINFLYRNRHMSPFEHGHFTFKVDVPLFVAREWHRHRTMSYNEVSGRYTEFQPRFYLPARTRPLVQEGKMGNYNFVKGSDDQYAKVSANQRWIINESWQSYQRQLEAGVAKEVARMVLPVSLMTQFYVTVNPRNLMQFLSLRDDSHALKEIRDAARQMDAIFRKEMPLTWKAFKRYKIEMVDQGDPMMPGGRYTKEEFHESVDKAEERGLLVKANKDEYIPRHKKNSKSVIDESSLDVKLTYAGAASAYTDQFDTSYVIDPDKVASTVLKKMNASRGIVK